MTFVKEAFEKAYLQNMGLSLAILPEGTAAVESPIPAIIRCILSGGGSGDRGFGAQPLEHTRPS